MKIYLTNNSRQNFGTCHIKTERGVKLPPHVETQMLYIKDILDKTSAKDITVFLNIEEVTPSMSDEFLVRVKTNIKEVDLEKFQKINPKITKKTYSKRSHWFRFDETLTDKIFDFVNKQNNYIQHAREELNKKAGIDSSSKDFH